MKNICFFIVEVNAEEAVIYEELLALNTESSLAYFGSGKVKLFQKDFTQAETLLRDGTALLQSVVIKLI
jgi:hypothetical protein